mmetsp:Transcript_2851/g.2926  ORF Transcript_2851/g.2926 Transcript_2851/m.2926 type:complete len:87 (+) Transcript_2851:37-297(+)
MNIQEKIIDGEDTVRNYMFEYISRAYNERTDDKAIAEFIRERLEERDPGKWNVIVGKDFGSHVSHLSKRYGYWKLGEQYVLIWQSG